MKKIELSPRQLQILTDVAHGFRDKEIACRLGISIHTVREQGRRAMGKLNAVNRENLVWLGRHFIES